MLKFKQFDRPKLDFRTAVKKPIPIRCIQMDEPFEVETMEGTMQGKKGDWLMVGVDGELYPCADEIFRKSYQIIEG